MWVLASHFSVRIEGMFRITVFVCLSAALALVSSQVDAGSLRRTVRIDFGTWEHRSLDLCPGASSADLELIDGGTVFVASPGSEFLHETFCQVSTPQALTQTGFGYAFDEPGLAHLLSEFESAPGQSDSESRVQGLRYTYGTADFRYAQWGVFKFPSGLVLISHYGLEFEDVGDEVFIKRLDAEAPLWAAGRDGLNNQYFCFWQGAEAGNANDWNYLGQWGGTSDSLDQACGGALRRVFQGRFE